MAWLGMVVSYSQAAPLSEALEKTFDGRHPCCLCKEIAKARQTDKKPESVSTTKRFEFSYSSTTFVFLAPSFFWELIYADDSSPNVTRTPPVPPPRRFTS
jgi:hypothetical protein